MISNLYIVKDYPLYGVGLVRAFTVESLLLNILSSCCFVVKMGGLAGISCRSFLICTRVRDSFDHLERSYGNIYRCNGSIAMHGMVMNGTVWYCMVV